MKTAFLVPVSEGVTIPQSKALLPKEGAEMPLDNYWRRRLMFGEVKIGTPQKKETPKIYERKEI